MPAGNPVINTTSSVPLFVDVGRDPRTQQRLAHSLPTVASRRVRRRRTSRGGQRRCRPTNNGEQQRSANSSDSWSVGRKRHASAASTRSSARPLATIVVIGAVVATVVITNRDSGSQTASAATTTPDHPRAGDTRRSRGPLPAFAAPAGLGAELPVPGVGGEGEQAEQPAPHRQGADRPGADQRQHGDQPGQHRPACSTTASRRARSTASPAWPSRASSTTRRATG